MIEFNGELTDNTLKYLRKSMIRNMQGHYIFFLVFGLPMLFFSLHFVMPLKYILFIVLPILAVAAVFVPHLIIKASKDRFVPKRISINDGLILFISDSFTDNKKIEQVKKVKDYGEYYVLTFAGFFTTFLPYICQKDLITQGTLAEFEALFEGKIKNITQGDGSFV